MLKNEIFSYLAWLIFSQRLSNLVIAEIRDAFLNVALKLSNKIGKMKVRE